MSPNVTESLKPDYASEFWNKISEVGWAAKTTDYKQVERDLIRSWPRRKAAKMRRVFRDLNFALTCVVEKELVGIGYEDSCDLCSHIVGLGQAEYEATLKDAKLARRRYEGREFSPGFFMAIPWDHAYLMQDPKEHVQQAKQIVVDLEAGLKDPRFESVFPQIQELVALFLPATNGNPLAVLPSEARAWELQKLLRQLGNQLGLEHQHSTAVFAYGYRVGIFFNELKQYLAVS
jgi:hypothetical protein